MLKLLKTMQESHIRYLCKTKLTEKTIKQKSKAIDDFILFVGVSLAVHKPEILTAFERKK